jgi:hypothetical protein
VTFGERICSQKHHGPSFRKGKWRANAEGVRSHQVHLQFADLVAQNPNIAQFADSSRDRVRQLIPGHNLVHYGARQIYGLASIGRE